MGIIDKGTIEKWILPYLSKGKRGFKPRLCKTEIVMAIFYRLKTGCQWRELPVKQFTDTDMSWQSVYYYFNKWSKDGSWRRVWINLLRQNHKHLDLSSVQLDGSHTLAKRGGESVSYQGRKASKTTNSLFLADNIGQMLGMSAPQEGRHHDLYKIRELFNELCELLKEAGIDIRGIFLNGDPGFDSEELRQVCSEKDIEANIKENPRNKEKQNDDIVYRYFDEQLYKRRTVIEHANAWLDSFKGLLVRYEVLAINWMAMHWMAFSVRFLRKINSS